MIWIWMADLLRAAVPDAPLQLGALRRNRLNNLLFLPLRLHLKLIRMV